VNNKSIPPSQNVILAIDGSEHANAAVQLIQNLPLPVDCTITLLSILIPRNAQYHSAVEKLLTHTQKQLQSSGRCVDTRLLTGYPAEQIIDYSNENNPTLIVLGAKGLRGTLKILLGGVAQQVVEYAQCPVLLVRAPHTKAKNVLLVTDGSKHSQFAIQHLESCPLPEDSKITVMHVLPPEMTTEMLIRSWPYGIDALPPVLSSDIDDSLAKRALEETQMGEELLNQTLVELSSLNIDADTILKRGDAATEIIKHAEENQIDLIIAGSRGLSQVRSWLLGSVSSKLTHYANCSVLVIK